MIEALLYVAFGLAVTFVAAELATRWWLKRFGRYYVWAPNLRFRSELQPGALPRLAPVVRFHVNSDGERGEEAPKDLGDTYRLVVCGGSAAECFYIDQDECWTGVLHKELNAPERLAKLGTKRAHVGNISRSLVRCEFIDWMLSKVLHRYERLDCVVFMVGASDVVHWLEKKAPPELPDEPLDTKQAFGEHPEGPFGFRPKTLALRRVLSSFKRRLLKPEGRRTNMGWRIAAARKMRAAATELIDTVPDPKPMIEGFDHHFRKAIARARTKAKRVVVVRQPWFDREFSREEEQELWNFGVGRPLAGQEVKSYYTHRLVRELMEKVDRRCAEVCDDLGVEHVDLRPVLPLDFDTYYDFLHHTPAGCALVARTVADEVAGTAAARGAPAEVAERARES